MLMDELGIMVPRQRGAARQPPPPPAKGTLKPKPASIAHRLSHWRKRLLQGTDPNLANVSFEAYYFDGAHSLVRP